MPVDDAVARVVTADVARRVHDGDLARARHVTQSLERVSKLAHLAHVYGSDDQEVIDHVHDEGQLIGAYVLVQRIDRRVGHYPQYRASSFSIF